MKRLRIPGGVTEVIYYAIRVEREGDENIRLISKEKADEVLVKPAEKMHNSLWISCQLFPSVFSSPSWAACPCF